MPGCSGIKFADDTTVTGLILHNDESNFRKQIDLIVNWCSKNNLHLNVDKTKEIIVDFRRGETPPPPLLINGATVERVPSFKFLGTHVSDKLTWDINLGNIVKKARQRLYFLRKLKSFDVGSDISFNFYRATIESVLTLSITVWFGRTSKASLARPQQSDLRLSGPPSSQGAGGGARTRDRSVPADLRADSLATMPPTPPLNRTDAEIQKLLLKTQKRWISRVI
ncbi:reverse transcriptase [Plakobranchus ocellatus]|uniref:Reverse transcriptase n=1 Tax=Plakobranchus ocellatus TaxID=259542 RepID=A0AAV4D878_9GAST|nr:reverse transcriptase [Plakobranchus ocellatus]